MTHNKEEGAEVPSFIFLGGMNMKIKIVTMLLVLLLFVAVPTVNAASAVSISQAGADSNTVMKGMAFTVTVSGLSGTGTVSLINQSWFSMDESNEKQFSSSTVSWTTVVANQKLSAQSITATVTVAGSPESATSNSFDIILPPSIVTSVTPSSITANDSTSHTVQLNIQNYGETIAKDVVVVISPPSCLSVTSGNGTQTISTIDGGAGGSGESVGRSWILLASSPTNSTITITVTPSNADVVTETVSVVSTASTPISTPTPTPTPSDEAGSGGGGGGSAPESGNLVTDSTGRVSSTTVISTTDGKSTLTIPVGTSALDSYGGPLESVTIASTSVGGTIAAFDLGPDGARFDPSLSLTINYDPEDVLEGKTVVVKMFDGAKWISLKTTVNTASATATVEISHFSKFALFLEDAPAVTKVETPASTATPVPTTTVAPTTTQAAKPSSALPLPWITLSMVVIVIAALVVVAYVVYRRRG